MTPAEFSARTEGIAYANRGIFPSEAYLFTRMCLDAGVTAIAESGVASGVSTRLLRAVWSDVTSFEWNVGTIPDDLSAVVTRGDGRVLVPQWVSARPHQRLGVFLDGPKGPRGTLVREWCLAQPQVRIVGQHDCQAGHGEDAHSADLTFRRDCGDEIDAAVPRRYLEKLSPQRGLSVWINRSVA